MKIKRPRQQDTHKINRRIALGKLLTGSAFIALPLPVRILAATETMQLDMDDIESMRNNWRQLQRDNLELPAPGDSFSRTEEQWQELFSDERYAILREADTEEAFSSPLNEEERAGLYLCAGCKLPLFTSAMKYESGTGWPSFFTTIPGVFETRQDFSLILPRTEYHCVRCGSHQGHLFDDGPKPTSERWCNNGLALVFEPAGI
tara:strand:- start:10380 stop:10991 length:612 start_codon:yes stop_codon:yes gene_type:complete